MITGNKTIIGAGFVSLFACLLITIAMLVSMSNTEKRLRNAITAKQRDNQSELDNAQKTIRQTAQIPPAQMAALKDIIVGNAQARKSGAGTLATFVHEAVPTVDTQTFQNLMNIIAGTRAAWTTRQKELLDLKREHDNCIDVFPSSLVCGGRPKIDVTIVTSTRAEESFRTGKDDDTQVFVK